VYGADAEFVVHAGLYAATFALPRGCDAGREMFLLRKPGRLVALHPCQGNPLAYFVYWHSELPEFDYRNMDQHKRLLESAFAGLGWRVPDFVAAARAASDMYFDQVARVHVQDWSRGRIALLGDAASCVSLFGDGSTLAMAGAYQLAAALAEYPADPQRAFRRYQAIHGKRCANGGSCAHRVMTPERRWRNAGCFPAPSVARRCRPASSTACFIRLPMRPGSGRA
jgi:2-polyprenyl-6-methoxyphenol hydroxylase-like FAD-dependent oxidoreductase